MSLIASGNLINPAINGRIGNLSTGALAGGAVQLILRNLLNTIFGFVGLILLIMVIRGGYQYITAGGDKESLQKAVKTITSALVGAVILLSLFAVISIIETLFGINLRATAIFTP